MSKILFANYAHEDQTLVMPVLAKLKAMGLTVRSGGAGEEKLAGVSCIISFATPSAPSSRSYKKVIGAAIRLGLPQITIPVDDSGQLRELFAVDDALGLLLRERYDTEALAERVAMIRREAANPQTVAEAETAAAVSKAGESTGQAQAASEKPQTGAQAHGASNVPAASGDGESAPAAASGLSGTSGGTLAEGKASLKSPAPSAEAEALKTSSQLTREACYEEGMRYLTGDGCEIDEAKAFEILKMAASKGHVEAQYQLSICYDKGQGTRRSISEAAKWCEMAAYGGHVQAQSEIGYCYEYGQGVVRNIREAVRWYRIAAEQGNIHAANNLAFCYQKGRGVTRDMDEAIRLYQLAADGGHSSAQYNLGFCYWYGEGIETDKEKAIALFKASADLGNAKAVQMLKILGQHAYLKKDRTAAEDDADQTA